MDSQLIVTIVCACLGSGGVLSFIQYLLNRRDKCDESHKALSDTLEKTNKEIHESLDEIKDDIQDLKDDLDQMEAVNARIRILQASDNIRHTGTKHSEEFFDQLNEDITVYEKYCSKHAAFKNNKAGHAIEYINSIYQKALVDNNFL